MKRTLLAIAALVALITILIFGLGGGGKGVAKCRSKQYWECVDPNSLVAQAQLLSNGNGNPGIYTSCGPWAPGTSEEGLPSKPGPLFRCRDEKQGNAYSDVTYRLYPDGRVGFN